MEGRLDAILTEQADLWLIEIAAVASDPTAFVSVLARLELAVPLLLVVPSEELARYQPWLRTLPGRWPGLVDVLVSP